MFVSAAKKRQREIESKPVPYFHNFGLQTDLCPRNVFTNKHISQITDDMINGF